MKNLQNPRTIQLIREIMYSVQILLFFCFTLFLSNISLAQKDKNIAEGYWNVNESTLESILNESKTRLLVLYFDPYLSNENKHQPLLPSMDKMAMGYRDKVIIGNIQQESINAIAKKYAITQYPSVLYIKNTQVVDKIHGFARPIGIHSFVLIENKMRKLLGW